jgi:hypothetical protein
MVNVPLYTKQKDKSVKSQDLIVVQINPLKFVTLELDADLNELAIACMHNLSNDLRL